MQDFVVSDRASRATSICRKLFGVALASELLVSQEPVGLVACARGSSCAAI
jgi:predicted ATPase